jgi:N6-adenosine-specific RNA methylase IME4
MPNARRLELFSRTDRKGWTAWGDEAGKFGAAP